MNDIAKQLGYLSYYTMFPYEVRIGFITQVTHLDNGTTDLYAQWIYKPDYFY